VFWVKLDLIASFISGFSKPYFHLIRDLIPTFNPRFATLTDRPPQLCFISEQRKPSGNVQVDRRAPSTLHQREDKLRFALEPPQGSQQKSLNLGQQESFNYSNKALQFKLIN